MNDSPCHIPRGGAPAALPDSHISGTFVRTMICLMVLLTLGMVCLVFYRSQSFIEPTAAAVVIGDRSLDGARLAVMSNGRELVGATLNADNRYTTPLLLQPGIYELDATCNGQMLCAKKFRVAPRTYVTFDLPTTVAVDGDATLLGAHVELAGPNGTPTSAVLNAENAFSAVLYRLPGRYHLTVTHNGQVIRDEQIEVALHKPRRIALIARLDPDRFSDESN